MGWLADRFELRRQGEGENIAPMEGLRGLAVALVFLVHYVSTLEPWIGDSGFTAALAQGMHSSGNTGVDLFFFLSGYLIYGSVLSRPQPFTKFIARRIQRLYPAFIVVFLIYVLLSLAMPSRSKIPQEVDAAAWYLLQNLLLLPGLFPIEPMITVAWSLSYELFFYVLIPVVVAALGLRSWPSSFRFVLFLTTMLVIAGAFVQWGGPIRMMMFLGGMLVYEAGVSQRRPSLAAPWGCLGFLVGCLVLAIPGGGSLGAAAKFLVVAIGFYCACRASLSGPPNAFQRALCFRPLRWLGNMSYSYYLLHGLALNFLGLIVQQLVPAGAGGGVLFWVALVPFFLFTLIPSAVLFLCVEKPYSLVVVKSSG